MDQTNSSIEIYQFRIALRETSPHIWRRLLVPSNVTLITFHRVIQTAFGWSGRRSFSFHVQGHPQKAVTASDPGQVSLSDLGLYLKERFSYEEENRDSMSRPWRFQIRLEKKLPMEERGRYPRCVSGSGAPIPEDCGARWRLRAFVICLHRTTSSIAWRRCWMKAGSRSMGRNFVNFVRGWIGPLRGVTSTGSYSAKLPLP
jgi:hypothetical protein